MLTTLSCAFEPQHYMLKYRQQRNSLVHILRSWKHKEFSQQDLADKIKISRAQINRYENQAVQPPADVLNKLAKVLDTTVDYMINGAIEAKAQATLKDSKILEQYRELEHLPDAEKTIIVKVVNALIRDFKTRQSYSIAKL